VRPRIRHSGQPTAISSKSGLIDAVGTFGNNTFQTVRFHELQHLGCRLVGHLGEPHVIAGLDQSCQDASAPQAGATSGLVPCGSGCRMHRR
jgi:hypothetical protein